MKLFIVIEPFGGVFKTLEMANEIAEQIDGYVEIYDTETEACYPADEEDF